MKPVSIIIVLSAILYFNENVFADNEINAKLNEDVNIELIDENNELIDENRKLVNDINKQIIDIRKNLKLKKKNPEYQKQNTSKAVKSFPHTNSVKKQSKVTLSSQLAEAKEKCWNVRLVSPRIISDTTPVRDESTWMVAIFQVIQDPQNTTKFICGGCLISSWYVLTSARCFLNTSGNWYAKKYEMLSVRYGMHDLSSQIYSETGVLKIHIHPNYWNVKGIFGDIALVKLKKTITYSSVVSPICIPYLTTPTDWTYLKTFNALMISGWGQTAPGNGISITLQKGLVEIVKHTECKKGFAKEINYNSSLTMCVGAKPNQAKICDGNSGSPAVVVIKLLGNPNIEFPVAMGIVSEGEKKCGGNFLLTSVESYIEWINTQTGK